MRTGWITFGLLGLAVGLVAAAVVYAFEPSWALAALAYVLGQYTGTRVVWRAVEGDRWLVAAAFPLVAVLVLLAAYGAWEDWTKSAAVALVVAAFTQPLLDQTERWAEPGARTAARR